MTSSGTSYGWVEALRAVLCLPDDSDARANVLSEFLRASESASGVPDEFAELVGLLAEVPDNPVSPLSVASDWSERVRGAVARLRKLAGTSRLQPLRERARMGAVVVPHRAGQTGEPLPLILEVAAYEAAGLLSPLGGHVVFAVPFWWVPVGTDREEFESAWTAACVLASRDPRRHFATVRALAYPSAKSPEPALQWTGGVAEKASLSLPLALAGYAALAGRAGELDPHRRLATGTVTADGTVGDVGDLDAKPLVLQSRARGARLIVPTSVTGSDVVRPVPNLLLALAEAGLVVAESAAALPPPTLCLGREDAVRRLVAALPAGNAVVYGLGGIGKTTLATEALHAPEVLAAFGTRRVFVRLEAAANADAALGALAAGMGVVPVPDLRAKLMADLSDRKPLVVLDNFETPWEGAAQETEALLADLAATGATVLVTVRGGRYPTSIRWRERVETTRLEPASARELFLHHAGPAFDVPELDALLRLMDGWPLALMLLGRAAQTEPDVAAVRRLWDEGHAAVLERDSSRTGSVPVSVEISLRSRRMTSEARRLVRLLASLPAGVARAHLPALLPGCGLRAAGTLKEVGLAFETSGRLKVLAPVAEYVGARAEPLVPEPEAGADTARVRDHYLRMATELGPKAGAEGGAEAIASLAPELANCERVIRDSFETPFAERAIDAACALCDFIRFSGLGDGTIIADAAVCAAQGADAARDPRCRESLGRIALARSDHEGARAKYEEALPRYRQVGDVLGEANCIMRLGDIALARSDHEGARAKFEEALPRYRQVGDVLGEANCIMSLGNIALERSDHEGARAKFEEALPRYRQVGDVLGEGNCVESLGRIALAGGRRDEAHRLFLQALGLYERIPEPYSIGVAHRLLARLETGAARAAHLRAAREAWTSIDRRNLLAGLDKEFGSKS